VHDPGRNRVVRHVASTVRSGYDIHLMRPVARHLMVLVAGTLVALTAFLAYFFTPIGVGGRSLDLNTESDARPGAISPVPSIAFVDVTANSHITFTHFAGETIEDIRQVMSPGFGLADLNGDKLIDMFFVNSAGPGATRGPGNALYLNRGGMQFELVPNAGGADAGEWGMGCTIADYDLDGDQDIYVTALGPNRLYRNDGHARFQDVAEAARVADPRWSTGAAFADYDLDGDLDLYIANYLQFDPSFIPAQSEIRYDRNEPPAFSPYVFPAQADALLRNDRGVYSDVTESSGIHQAEAGKGMAVLFADLTRDRLPDLLVINDVSFNSFFRNMDGRTFEDAGAGCGLADPRSGMGVALGDYDNDGAFDVFSTHWQDESNVLYRNLSNLDHAHDAPFFEDVTIQVGLAAPSMGRTGWGASWADLDLDGDLDLLVANGYTSPAASDPTQCIGQPVMLFLNEGGRFVDHAAGVGLADMSQWAARGAVTSDLDDDGDLDIVISVNNGPVRVFENRLAGGHWLKVRPVGGVVIGTVVRIRCGTTTQQRMIVGGSSYLCGEPPEVHFGTGDSSVIDRLEVCWPDGTIQVFEEVPSNQSLMIRKP